MPTILSNTLKNGLLDFVTGRVATSTNATQPYCMNMYNGAQAADPTSAPGGTWAFAQTSYSPSLLPQFNGFMGAGNNGVSALSTPRPSTASGQIIVVSNCTTARIFSAAATNSYVTGALIDTPVTLTGNGGGCITNKITTTTTSDNFTVTNFKIKLLTTTGTVSLGMATVNRLLDNMNMITTATPALLTSGTMTIYDGTMPSSADLPAVGNVLSTTTLASTSPWNAASAGSAALGSAISITASGTGTATYVRFTKGAFVMQGTVGTASGDFILNSVSFVSGNSFSMTSGTLTI